MTSLPCVSADPDINLVQTTTTEFPFAIRLPESIPSTFHGLYGGIQYWIKVSLTFTQKPEVNLITNKQGIMFILKLIRASDNLFRISGDQST